MYNEDQVLEATEYDAEDYYDNEIDSKLEEVRKMCRDKGLPMFACVAYACDGDGYFYGTHGTLAGNPCAPIAEMIGWASAGDLQEEAQTTH